MATRDYTTRRLGIVNGLVDKLKTINGAGHFLTDLNALEYFEKLVNQNEIDQIEWKNATSYSYIVNGAVAYTLGEKVTQWTGSNDGDGDPINIEGYVSGWEGADVVGIKRPTLKKSERIRSQEVGLVPFEPLMSLGA